MVSLNMESSAPVTATTSTKKPHHREVDALCCQMLPTQVPGEA